MSTKIMNWVWHDPSTEHLRGNAFTALLALADIADDDGHVIYAKGVKRSQAALAKKARMSVATFRRMTDTLASQGLLQISRESQRTENEYRVIVTAQVERSQMSGQSAHSYERSERSPSERSSAVTPLKGRSDVLDVPPVVPVGDPIAEAFEQVWQMWPPPRRGTTKKSGSSFRTAIAAIGGIRHLDTILDAIRRDVAVWRTWPRSDVQFIPLLSTWLNQERWQPSAAAMPRGPRETYAQQKQDNNLALLAEYREGDAGGEVTSGRAGHLRAIDPGA